MFSYFADHTREQSVASQLRRKRLKMLLQMIASFPSTVNILDVGGRPKFWERIFSSEPFLVYKLKVTLINIEKYSSSQANVIPLVGDGRAMPQFADGEFEIVFSNSTIEHVGSLHDQKRMADEVRRIGQKYMVQTPNKYFPIEPHFVFPMFQFLPISIRAWLLQNFRLGWRSKTADYQKALASVKSIRLLSKAEFKQMFPEACIYEEKFYGLTKSFVAHTT